MQRDTWAAEVRAVWAAGLGHGASSSLAELMRPGFTLHPAGPRDQPSGGCRIGGAALLEPGTPWPEYDGVPLSLLVVVDTSVLAPWLGQDLPCRPGLLNFFYFTPDLPYHQICDHQLGDPLAWRVVPADPERAEPRSAPAPAKVYTPHPLLATPVMTMPDSFDEVLNDFDFGMPGDEHFVDRLKQLSDLCDAWAERVPRGGHRAFGWPWLLQGPVLHEGDTHLLQLDSDDQWQWGDVGVLYYTIPREALRLGEFGEAMAQIDCC